LKIGYHLRAAFHNLGLFLRTLVGTGKPLRFSVPLRSRWIVGFALRNALWKRRDTIRDLRIRPNRQLQATIDRLGKLKRDRSSRFTKHTAVFNREGQTLSALTTKNTVKSGLKAY